MAALLLLIDIDREGCSFDTHVISVPSPLPIAAVACPTSATAQSLCATPGTVSLSAAAATPTFPSNILVLISRQNEDLYLAQNYLSTSSRYLDIFPRVMSSANVILQPLDLP